MKMINKKGTGLEGEELVKIIIALICISFLIYFAVLIYQGSREKNESRQAKSTLDEIVLRVEKIDTWTQSSYLYLAPRSYYFRAADDLNKLTQCSGKYCLCLCDESKCNGLNICKETTKPFALNASMVGKEIETPQTYMLINEPEYYRIHEVNVSAQ